MDLTFSAHDVPGAVSALRTHGCCLVRGLASRWAARRLYRAFPRLYGDLPEAKRGADPKMLSVWQAHRGPEEASDPALLLRLSLSLFRSGRLARLAAEYFAAPPVMVHSLTSVRHYQPGAGHHYLGFHQDIDVLPPEGLTVWTPLQTIAGETPGLQLIPGSPENDHGLRVLPRFMLSETDRAGNAALEAERIWTPDLDLGDALIFRPFTLHRTRPMSGGKERRSIDIRLLPNL